MLGDDTMQRKIQAAPTMVYPESDRETMAETDKHRDLMVDFIQILRNYYQNEKDVYVSGNLLMYYEKGNPKKSISPDVFVVFGVEKKQRNTYLIWAEAQTPDFVLEVASPSTFSKDIGEKKELYASVLAVKEYYIYDPMGQIVPSFVGYRLIDGVYQEIDFVNDRLPSETLGLALGEHDGNLRLYNPTTSQWLQTPQERAKSAEARAQQEANARKNAEAELEKALAEIKRLRTIQNE